jgi:tetratricopeptide (TPR) repeat protein
MANQLDPELLFKFIYAQDPAELRLLIEDNPVLMTEQIKSILQLAVRKMNLDNPEQLLVVFEQRMLLLDRCQELGIDQAFLELGLIDDAKAQDFSVSPNMAFKQTGNWMDEEVFFKLISAQDAAELYILIEDNPALMTEQLRSTLRHVIGKMSNDQSGDLLAVLEQRLLLLERCQELGIDKAFIECRMVIDEEDHEFSVLLKRALMQKDMYLKTNSPEALDPLVLAWGKVKEHPGLLNYGDDIHRNVLMDFGNVCAECARVSRNKVDINTATEALSSALDKCKKTSDRLEVIELLSGALWVKYDLLGELNDLEEVISLRREVDQELSGGDAPRKAKNLGGLAAALLCRYERMESAEDLHSGIESVTSMEKYGRKLPPPNLSDRLFELSKRIYNNFGTTNNLSSLSAALSSCKESLRLMSGVGAGYDERQHLHGQILLNMYGISGEIEVLESALRELKSLLGEKITSEIPGEYLHTYGNCLLHSYKATHDKGQLDAAIQFLHEAVNKTRKSDTHYSAYRFSYGSALILKHKASGNISDLKQNIELFKGLIKDCPPGNELAAKAIVNLQLCLSACSELTGDIGYLDDAITQLNEYLKKVQDCPHRLQLIISLGNSILEKYDATGGYDEVQRLSEFLSSEELLTRKDEEQYNFGQNLLGRICLLAYRQNSKIEQIDRAITHFSDAIRYTKRNASHFHIFWNNLGTSYKMRYEIGKNIADLDKAKKLHQKAFDGIDSESSERFVYAMNIANCLSSEYFHTRNETLLDEAIEFLVEMLTKVPEDTSAYYDMTSTLANNLSDRWFRTKNLEDLNQAIKYQKDTLANTRGETPHKVRILNNLGVDLSRRFEATHDEDDFEEATDCWRKCCQMGVGHNIGTVLQAAKTWGELSLNREDWRAAGEAFSYSVGSIKKIINAQVSIEHKENWIRKIRDAAVFGSFALAKLNELEGAVDMLERGRAIVLSNLLEQGQFDEMKNTNTGFEQNKTFVYLVAAHSGGMSLIIRGNQKKVIWLPDMSIRAVHNTFSKYIYALEKFNEQGEKLSETSLCNNSFDQLLGANDIYRLIELWNLSIDKLTRWIWDVAMSSVLNHIAPEETAVFIPTGLLSFFPLHAAWTEDRKSPHGRKYAIDQIAITYSPTITSHVMASNNINNSPVDSILCIENPQPGGGAPLKNAHREVSVALRYFKHHEHLKHEHASRTRIIKEIGNYSVLHFVCHGKANFETPWRSHLRVSNGEVITLEDFLRVKKLSARIALLSACETALSGHQIPDEVVSFPTGILLAGVGGVIGTLWPVEDSKAADLIQSFYRHWRGGKSKMSPHHALRAAQLELRRSDDSKNLSAWAAFAYVGV